MASLIVARKIGVVQQIAELPAVTLGNPVSPRHRACAVLVENLLVAGRLAVLLIRCACQMDPAAPPLRQLMEPAVPKSAFAARPAVACSLTVWHLDCAARLEAMSTEESVVDQVNIMMVDSVVTSAPLFVEPRDAARELARTECVCRLRMVALLLVVLEIPATRYLIVPARQDTKWNAHKVVVSTRRLFHSLIGHFGNLG